MLRRKGFRTLAIVAVAVGATLAVQTAFASGGGRQARSQQGPATVSSGGGSNVTQVRAAGSDANFTTSSTSFVNLPGTGTQVSVPAGTHGLFIAEFTAETNCNTGSNICDARIVLKNAAGTMVVAKFRPEDNDFHMDDSFDVCGGSTCNENGGMSPPSTFEGNAMQRFLSRVNPGTYRVQVQVKVTGTSGTSFALDDYSLVVFRSTQP